MSNSLLTPTQVTREAMRLLVNNLTFTRQINRNYDDAFQLGGAKVGTTINVRRPARYVGVTGAALSTEAQTESSIPLSLNTQFHVDVTFTTNELTTQLQDFGQRVLAPAVATVANRIDRDGLLVAKNNTANLVGTPGVTPNSLFTYLQAGAFLSAEGAPQSDRSIVVDPFAQAVILDSLKGLFQSGEKIADQYTSGQMMGMTAGFSWFMDQNVVTHQVGPLGGTPLINGASQGIATGFATTTSLITDGWTAAAANRLKQGDVITIAGVNAVNPQNRQSYGQLRRFVVTADASSDASGNLTAIVSPAIIRGGQFQNVDAAPADNAAITVVGSANQNTPQHMAFHRDAYCLATADLEMPQGVHFAARVSDKQTGLSLRAVRQYTISNDQIPMRLDVLYGWAALYPELGCRIAG